MDIFLYLSLLCLLFTSLILLKGTNDEVKKYRRKQLRLKRKLKDREVNKMSKLIDELVGKKCKLDGYGVIEVLAADDEWMKFSYTDKRGNKKTRIERVENLDSIEILDEEA